MSPAAPILLCAMSVLTPVSALAQYKCTTLDGAVSFQQSPCAGNTKGQRLDIKVAPPAEPASAAGSVVAPRESVEQRMVRGMAYERKVRELEGQIANVEARVAQRNGQMTQELALLAERKRLANNNLAGAVWQQSISAEMQAIATKHQALNEADLARLKALRVELGELRQSPPNGTL